MVRACKMREANHNLSVAAPIAVSSYSCLLLYLEEAQQEYSSDNRTPDADPYPSEANGLKLAQRLVER